MLRSSKLKSITSERTLLKNLGAWLGKLTLANNRPVLQVGRGLACTMVEGHRRAPLPASPTCADASAHSKGSRTALLDAITESQAPEPLAHPPTPLPPSLPHPGWPPLLQKHLDVKAAILEAYEQGKMLAVLSFVRMLLEPAMDSRVFRPPNPWVMAILALLVEVYNLDNIKTGLKFEVGGAAWGGHEAARDRAAARFASCERVHDKPEAARWVKAVQLAAVSEKRRTSMPPPLRMARRVVVCLHAVPGFAVLFPTLSPLPPTPTPRWNCCSRA